MTLRFTDHARQRLRERRLPPEAVALAIAELERVEVLDAGTWSERYRHRRRMGRRRVEVVWVWEHADRVVLTVMVGTAARPDRGE